MFIKKTAIILTTLFAITGTVLSGCGSSNAPAGSVDSSPSNAAAPAQPTEISLYVTSSQNVKDFWDAVIPKFEKQVPDVKVNLVFTASGTGSQTTYDRIMAAKQANKGSGDIDIYEDGLSIVTRGQKDGLWDTLSTDKIPNLSKVDPATMKDIANMAVPYRASAVRTFLPAAADSPTRSSASAARCLRVPGSAVRSAASNRSRFARPVQNG
jgi:putative spermidine/putrescine transport system substrate-binding protein